MQFNQFIGVDISKASLDICLFNGKDILQQATCDNSLSALKQLFGEWGKFTDWSKVLICAEHTGLYSAPLVEVSKDLQAPLWLENPTEIKLRSGMNRGKNDRVDSMRIAQYASRFADKAKLVQVDNQAIEKIKHLSSEREMLLCDCAKYKAQLNDQVGFLDSSIYKNKANRLNKTIKLINSLIKEIDQEINLLVLHCPIISKQFDQLISIDGIGRQTAIHTIVATRAFTAFENPRKFCCHAGVAPFAYLSGSSQRTRWKVSHRANKRLKKLYHMAALSAITMEGELKDYYQRKVEEGKNKMSVINAVRAKLIHRAFAIVRDNRKYEKNYIHTLA